MDASGRERFNYVSYLHELIAHCMVQVHVQDEDQVQAPEAVLRPNQEVSRQKLDRAFL